jgi:phosphonate transport system ATP-binding protein
VIGIAAGEVVFDGAPEALSASMVRHIYGVADQAEGFRESLTSTHITPTATPELLAMAA